MMTAFPDAQRDTAVSGIYTLEILHLSDQEGQASSVVNAPNASAIMNALEAQDLGNDGIEDNTIRLSSGDAIIPGVFLDASEAVFGSAGIADIQIQNELGFQAIALGNHEFDKGTEFLADLITGDAVGNFDALIGSSLEGQDFGGANFPYLGVNLDYSNDENFAPLVVESGKTPISNSVTGSVVIEENGEKIGVIGAITPTIARISSPGNIVAAPLWENTIPTEGELDALAAEIQTEIDALLAANPDMNKVILSAHMQVLGIEQALAARLENVDVIIAGGSNTLLADDTDRLSGDDEAQGTYPIMVENANGSMTAVVNTDGNYKYVGRLVIDFDENGEIIPDSYNPNVSGAYATDAQGVAELDAEDLIDPEVQAIADAIGAEIIASEGNVFGVSNVFLNGNRAGVDGDPDGVRTQETNLGNLTADANLEYARQYDESVMVSIKNGGGIRASIGETVVPAGSNEFVRQENSEITDANGNVIKPEGGISETDIKTTLSFNNGLTLLTLTRAELVEVLEHGVAALPNVAGQFPQISGVQFSFDPDRAPGDRIVNAAITDAEGNDIDVLVRDGEIVGNGGTEVRIVTLSFMASGGDGYPFPQGESANRVDLAESDETMRDGDAVFANNGSEQDALAEYLNDNFGSEEFAFNQADNDPSGDTRIQNLDHREDTVIDAPEFILIEGDSDRDRLTGTDADEIIASGEGRYDTMTGGSGADVFFFDDEALNGARERDIIRDFEVGIDAIGLGVGVSVQSIRNAGSSVVVYLDDPAGKNDAIYVRGDGVTADNLTFIDDFSFA